MAKWVQTCLLLFTKRILFKLFNLHRITLQSIRNVALSLATLASISFLSHLIVSYFDLRFSAAILSIFILFGFLVINKGIPAFLKPTADFLMKHMGLFLIPAVIMVLAYKDYFFAHGFSLLLVIVLSTFVSFAVVLLVTHKIVNIGLGKDSDK